MKKRRNLDLDLESLSSQASSSSEEVNNNNNGTRQQNEGFFSKVKRFLFGGDNNNNNNNNVTPKRRSSKRRRKELSGTSNDDNDGKHHHHNDVVDISSTSSPAALGASSVSRKEELHVSSSVASRQHEAPTDLTFALLKFKGRLIQAMELHELRDNLELLGLSTAGREEELRTRLANIAWKLKLEESKSVNDQAALRETLMRGDSEQILDESQYLRLKSLMQARLVQTNPSHSSNNNNNNNTPLATVSNIVKTIRNSSSTTQTEIAPSALNASSFLLDRSNDMGRVSAFKRQAGGVSSESTVIINNNREADERKRAKFTSPDPEQVAKRILETLGKMADPLDEVKKRKADMMAITASKMYSFKTDEQNETATPQSVAKSKVVVPPELLVVKEEDKSTKKVEEKKALRFPTSFSSLPSPEPNNATKKSKPPASKPISNPVSQKFTFSNPPPSTSVNDSNHSSSSSGFDFTTKFDPTKQAKVASKVVTPPPANDWGTRFGLKKDQWKCDVCSSKNKEPDQVCKACENPRKNAAAISKPVEEEALKPVFNLAPKSEVKFSFDAKKEELPEKTAQVTFSFDNKQPDKAKDLFSFAASNKDVNPPAPVLFAAASVESQTAQKPPAPLFSFKAEETKSEGGPTLGAPETKVGKNETQPFVFAAADDGNKKAKPEKQESLFSFGNSTNNDAPFVFGATAKEAPATVPAPFVFGESKKETSLFGTEKKDPPAPFQFGANPSAFTFGEAKEKKSEEPFIFGASSSSTTTGGGAPTNGNPPAFTFGASNNAKVETAAPAASTASPFIFGADSGKASNAAPANPTESSSAPSFLGATNPTSAFGGGLFSNNNNNSSGNNKPGFLFGATQQPQTSAGGLFGASTSASTFGATTTNPSSIAPVTSGLFGSTVGGSVPAPTFTPSQSFGFGGTQSQQPTAFPSAFGAAPAPLGFSTSNFPTQQQPGGMFGGGIGGSFLDRPSSATGSDTGAFSVGSTNSRKKLVAKRPR